MLNIINSPLRNKSDQTHLLLRKLNELNQFSVANNPKSNTFQILSHVLNLGIELIHNEVGCIYILTPEGKIQSHIVLGPLSEEEKLSLSEIGKTAIQSVVETHMPLFIPDYCSWLNHSKNKSLSYQAILSIPMLWDGQLLGILQMWDTQPPKYFHSETQELLSIFATHASALIHHLSLFEIEHQQRVLAEKLATSASTLTSSMDINFILENILHLLAPVVPYDSASILLVEGDQLTLVAQQGLEINKTDSQMNFPVDDALFQEIKHQKKPLILGDAARDARFKGWLNTKNVHGWMGVPLINRDKVIGYITLNSYQIDFYQEIQGKWASAFANQAAMIIENARLFHENESKANDLEALRQVSLSLTTNMQLENVLDAILKSIFLLLHNVRSAHIYLYYPNDLEHFHFGAAQWNDGKKGKLVNPPRENGLTALVAHSGKLIAVEDTRIHPLYQDLPDNWGGSIISNPLKISNLVVGVMNVSFSEPRKFPENELRLLGFLADQAAIAIQNARLYEQIQNEKRNLSVLYRISHELTSSVEPGEILNRAVALITKALGGQFGLGFCVNLPDEMLVLNAVSGEINTSIAEYNQNHPWQIGQGLVGWVAQYRQGVISPDVNNDPRWVVVSGIDDDIQSAICAPILFKDKLYGVIIVFHINKNAFGGEDLNLIQAICQEVGLALSNAERYQEGQYRLRQMLLLQKFSQSFTQHLELQDLLKTMVDELVQNFDYPTVEIYLRKDNELEQRARVGGVPGTDYLPLDRGLIGKAIQTKQAILAVDVTQESEYIPDIPNTTSELIVPIVHDEVVVGAINIETNKKGQITQNDYDFLRLLADQIAIALENARLYENVRQHANDLEKAVSERTAELSELYELSQEIGYTLNYEDLIPIFLKHLRNAVKCDFTLGCLLNNSKSTLLVNAIRPISPQLLTQVKGYCQNQLSQQVGQELTLASIKVNLEDNQAERSTIQQFQSIPYSAITLGDKIVGMIGIGDEKQKDFSEEQKQLLQTFANQARLALQRLEAIRQAENKRLGDIIEKLPSGILLLDNEYHILAMNSLAHQLLVEMNAVIENEVLIKLGPAQIRELINQQSSSIPKDIILEGNLRRVFETLARPISEVPTQWILTIREVTKERETQMRIQMQERLATVGQLAAGIAHDFNNIMAAILVYADLLRNEPVLSQAGQDRLAIIQQQVQRAASLIRQILDFSRRSVMEQSTLDLLPFIKEFEKMLRRVLPETINIELFYKPTQYLVNADPTRMQQVLMNLAVNSRDAMPNGGVITISLDRLSLKPNDPLPSEYIQPGEWVCISVQDTGEGIEPEHFPHIFEPFFTTKPIGLGTGLGLAQVYGIVKQHGGYIDGESILGKGTKFTIYLPAIAQPELENISNQPAELVDGAGKVVLIVEDDEATRSALKTLLEVQQYTVLTACDGVSALKIFEQTTQIIDLIISDIVMPKMGGLELFQSIQNKSSSVQMLMITGHPMKEENRTVLEKGNVHWLQKPFSIQDFNQAILELVR